MKKLVVLLLFCLPLTSVAQETAAPSGKLVSIYVNPLSTLLGLLITPTLLAIQGGVDVVPYVRFMTLGVTGQYSSATAGGTNLSAWMLGPRLNFYFSGNAIGSSFYASPWFEYGRLTSVSGGSTNAITMMEGVLVVGYHVVTEIGFQFRAGIGASYASVPTTMTVGSTTVDLSSYSGVKLALELSLGWAFF